MSIEKTKACGGCPKDAVEDGGVCNEPKCVLVTTRQKELLRDIIKVYGEAVKVLNTVNGRVAELVDSYGDDVSADVDEVLLAADHVEMAIRSAETLLGSPVVLAKRDIEALQIAIEAANISGGKFPKDNVKSRLLGILTDYSDFPNINCEIGNAINELEEVEEDCGSLASFVAEVKETVASIAA
jgi:hypothetical protein